VWQRKKKSVRGKGLPVVFEPTKQGHGYSMVKISIPEENETVTATDAVAVSISWKAKAQRSSVYAVPSGRNS
jgi:hypothetical protein